MVMVNYDFYKKVLCLPRDDDGPYRNHLGPPELILGPLKPPNLHLSSSTYKIGGVYHQ